MGHQTPGSSQCQYWGELGCPTPLEDPMLQPGDPKTWLCKAATAEWQRWEGGTMLGHTPAAMRKHGTPTPFLPHKAAPPPKFPFSRWHCPRRTQALATAQFSPLGWQSPVALASS